MSTIPCVSVGLGAELAGRLDSKFPALARVNVPYDADSLMAAPDRAPALVICGAPPQSMQAIEVAQLLRMQYRDIPIYLVAEQQAKFDRKDLVKNGFTDVFFLPLDREVLEEAVSRALAAASQGGKSYRGVKLLDIQPGSTLDFDAYLYMPVNGKYIKYIPAGGEIEPQRVDRLKDHKMASIFITADEMPRFHAYTARTLKSIGADTMMSETARSEKLHDAVRELTSGLFSDAATATDMGKKAIDDCQQVIRAYVTGGKKGSWYDRVAAAVSTSGAGIYSSATAVSAYAGLFAIGLGLPSVEDVALAGLLHDLGLAKVPQQILAKDPRAWSASERTEYEKHPEYAIELIRERKLVISELTHKIILQHHEKFNGSGYPKGLRGSRICVEAQLVAIADQFEELLRPEPGKPLRGPVDAVWELRARFAADPGQAIADPQLLQRVLALFP